MQLKDETRMLRDRAADLAKKSPMMLATKPGEVIDLVTDTLDVMEKMAARIDAMAGEVAQ
ncbi:hypothetical protein [uncultured Celeribacter sp.]|uniref:hypothetical protein n=1 Tax=uncultured Celeribacter sp. TaxID=1303376 RepID=UPI002AA90AF1|nr:hypothetical protein [uncultured Celeribacter sp.]